MTISKTAVIHGLTLTAAVITAGAAAVAANDTAGYVNAGVSAATAVSGLLVLFGAAKAASEVSVVAAAAPALVPVAEALVPVVEGAVKAAVSEAAKK